MRTPKQKHDGEIIALAIIMLLALAWLLTHDGCAHPIGNTIALAVYVASGVLLALRGRSKNSNHTSPKARTSNERNQDPRTRGPHDQTQRAGVRAETTKQTRKALADQYGVRIPVNQTPLNERESWTLNSAAKVWNIDYHALLIAANNGTLTTFRPPSRRGTRSWRRVTRKAMEEFIAQFEE